MAERHLPQRRSQQDNWVTVSVTALGAGWRSVHRLADGTIEARPIPAVLLQELRSTTHLRASTAHDTDEVPTDGTQDDHEPLPYGTRVVAARIHEGVELTPVDAGDVIGVVGPTEDVTTRFSAHEPSGRAGR